MKFMKKSNIHLINIHFNYNKKYRILLIINYPK